jgi:hypothetical protein
VTRAAYLVLYGLRSLHGFELRVPFRREAQLDTHRLASPEIAGHVNELAIRVKAALPKTALMRTALHARFPALPNRQPDRWCSVPLAPPAIGEPPTPTACSLDSGKSADQQSGKR